MATKSCPECDQQVPVACKSCPCGFVFISRRLLNAREAEKSSIVSDNKFEAKRRRTERVRRNSVTTKDFENRRRSRSNSQSEQIRRGRGRPKTVPIKKQDEEKAAAEIRENRRHTEERPVHLRERMEKQEREVDLYASLSDEKAFVFSVALAEINRKILNQRLILWSILGPSYDCTSRHLWNRCIMWLAT